ncbi:MAG: hypothetical protein HY353_00750 [Candidatus Omnitrophica bacterium]|nr:hypothetical protein [Candidatus Omnitrophota bacterium]
MALVAFRLAWPHVLAPWRSPLLRWRIETYGIQDEDGRMLHADDITARRFLGFALHHRIALLRFLRWAALL